MSGKQRKPAANQSRREQTAKQTKKPAEPPKQAQPAATVSNSSANEQNPVMPTRFPFWARLKISKRRTTLVIDEAPARDKQKKKIVPGYVHREATSVQHKGLEEINPNPDSTKTEPMYLKPARKLPKRLFEPHNKPLDMPEKLRKRYEGNNHKGDTDGNGEKKT